MRKTVLLSFWLPLGLLLAVALPSSAGPEPIAVIAHPSAGTTRLEPAELRALFTAAQRRWRNGHQAIPFNSPPGDALRRRFDEAVLEMGPDRVAKFWIDQRIRGKARPPRHVPSEALLGRVVSSLPGSVGYVRRRHVPRGVVVLAYITNGKVIPARDDKGSSK